MTTTPRQARLALRDTVRSGRRDRLGLAEMARLAGVTTMTVHRWTHDIDAPRGTAQWRADHWERCDAARAAIRAARAALDAAEQAMRTEICDMRETRMSHRQIARATGVAQSTVQRILRGRHE